MGIDSPSSCFECLHNASSTICLSPGKARFPALKGSVKISANKHNQVTALLMHVCGPSATLPSNTHSRCS